MTNQRKINTRKKHAIDIETIKTKPKREPHMHKSVANLFKKSMRKVMRQTHLTTPTTRQAGGAEGGGERNIYILYSYKAVEYILLSK